MKTTHHEHPRPTQDRIQQYGALALLVVMIIAVPLQLFIALALGAPLLAITAVLLALLMLPVIMVMTVSPALTLSDEGILLRPRIGRERLVRWEDIVAIKDYTLLPTANHEVERRAIQGKKKYRPAEGRMLIVRGLPPQYRIAGYFAGEGGQPIIAITNRAHTSYDTLVQRVEQQFELAMRRAAAVPRIESGS